MNYIQKTYININKLLAIIFLFSLLASCAPNKNISINNKETPHLYWKETTAQIISINKTHWFAGTHHYKINITVNSSQYNIIHSEELYYSGMYVSGLWNKQVGDEIVVRLYSWVLDSTGEVIKREIRLIS